MKLTEASQETAHEERATFERGSRARRLQHGLICLVGSHNRCFKPLAFGTVQRNLTAQIARPDARGRRRACIYTERQISDFMIIYID